MQKLNGQSADLASDNIDQLKILFPEAFTEGKVNFDVLKQLLGGAVDEREEKYGLNWHGKKAARQIALSLSNGTLRPCPDESVDWDTTQNLMIEGDNLEVLKLLQKSYSGKVKLIYIDPPYNTGNDFVYSDSFQDNIKNYMELTGQVEGGKKISSNAEASGRFHTDWLNMMYPRLKLARNLLREDGMIFVSIDDSEICNLRRLMDDVFGEERCVSQLVWKNKYNAGALTKGFSSVHEYILCYSKGEISNLTAPLGEDEIAQYRGRDSKYASRGGYVTQPLATSSKDTRLNLRYPIVISGREIWPEKQWIWSKDRIESAIANDEVVVNETDGKVSVRVKQYLMDEYGEMREMKPLSLLIGPFNQEGSKETKEILGDGVFSFPKPVRLIKQLASLTVNDQKDKNALVLDFFSGSGTTAQAVLEQNQADGGNRRYILVQLPEPLNPDNKDQKTAAEFCDKLGKPRTIAELTKERLRRAAQSISREAAKSAKENQNQKDLFASFASSREQALDLGFRVFKLDTSNINSWDPNRDDLEQTLLDHMEHIKPGRNEADILYELLLKLGLDLCVPIETRYISREDAKNANKTKENNSVTQENLKEPSFAPFASSRDPFVVHSIGSGVLFACLAESITSDEAEPLALGMIEWHKMLAPAGESTCVFRDSAFADDVAKSNLAAILEQHGISTVRSL